MISLSLSLLVSCVHSSMSVFRNAPGILVTVMYLLSFASITHVIIIASKDMVGKLSLVVYLHCDRMSAHPLSLMLTSCFFIKNIKYLRAFFLCLCDISLFLLGRSTCYSCSWFSSFSSASFSLAPNLYAPFTPICVISTWACCLATF